MKERTAEFLKDAQNHHLQIMNFEGLTTFTVLSSGVNSVGFKVRILQKKYNKNYIGHILM